MSGMVQIQPGTRFEAGVFQGHIFGLLFFLIYKCGLSDGLSCLIFIHLICKSSRAKMV